jgi:hypothetical protein
MMEPNPEPELDQEYEPRTELGKLLLEIRQRYLEAGGKFLTEEEFEQAMAEMRT